jgi:tetratricopeptide (TPR) repeat protein
VREIDPLIEELRTGYPEMYEVNREGLADWFEARVDAFLASGRFDDALDYLAQLRRLDPARAGDKRVLLVLQWARRERDQGQFERALDIYVNQLLPQSPEIARNRILDVLEQAEYQDRESDNLGRAIVLYERYGLEHVPTQAQRKLVDLWNELGFKHLNHGRLDDAQKSFTRVDQIKPGAATDGFLLLEHAERLDEVDPKDPLGLYELGEWCMGNGLLIEAKRAFLEAAETPALRTSSQAQLKFIDNTLNERELTRLVSQYEKGNYLDVLNGVHAFKGRPLSRGFRTQAEQLEQLTQDAIRLTVAERPQQAEVLWQQAERAFYTRDYASAQSLLRALIERYPDTPAGLRGEEFLGRIRPTLSLNQIEANPGAYARRATPEEDEGSDSPLGEEIRRLRRSPGSTVSDSSTELPSG